MPTISTNAKLSVFALVIATAAASIMRFIIGFDGLYGQDSYEYLRYAEALKTFMTEGTDPGDYFWPVWYPLSGALISFIIQDVAFSLQLISCLSLAIVFVFSYKIIQLLFPETHKTSSVLFVWIFVALSPFMLRLGFSVMADMLTLALINISSYYFIKTAKNGNTLHLILGGVAGTMACMTRYGAFVLILPIAVYGYWMFFRKTKFGFNVIPAFVLAIIPIVPHILIRGSHSASFIQHDWVSQWSMINFFKNSFTTRDGTAHNMLPNIIYAMGGLFHPRYCFAAVIILLFGFKKLKLSSGLVVIVIGLLMYLVFLAGIPYQNNRFLLLALPFFLFLLFNPWYSLMQNLGKRANIVICSLSIFVQVILFPFGFWSTYQRNHLERTVFSYLETKNSPDIYTMDIDVSLRGRNYPGKIYNIFTDYYEYPDTNALVIFNALTMPQQWNQMNPMKNWQHFNHEYQLKEIKRFNNGWAVHQFE